MQLQPTWVQSDFDANLEIKEAARVDRDNDNSTACCRV